MIGFDRPLRPHWIYESLLLADPGQKLSELKEPFENVACELTGKEGKRKVRTVIFRCFLRAENNKTRVRKEFVLKNLSSEHDLEFMKPIYLFYLIGRTETLFKISEHIFRLYDYGEELNIQFLKKKMVDELGERDVVIRSAGSFIQTLDYFGIAEKTGNKAILKRRLFVNDEQLRIILELYSREILQSPQISLNHLPKSVFNYFEFPNFKAVAQKYNGEYWDYQHRIKEDFLTFYHDIYTNEQAR